MESKSCSPSSCSPVSPGRVQRALELRDVEDRRDPVVAERGPHRIEVGVRQRLPVHRGRSDHGQPHALGPHPPDLLHRPGRVVQQDVGHAEEPARRLAADVGHEAVVGPGVGPLRDAVRGQPLLPQQPVVREQHRGVEPERVERRRGGRRRAGRSRAPARRTTPARARRAAGAGGPRRSGRSAPGSGTSRGVSRLPRQVSQGHPASSSAMESASAACAGSMYSDQVVLDSKRCWSTSMVCSVMCPPGAEYQRPFPVVSPA